jgi:hypothetical protein
LIVGGFEIGAPALVLPGEMTAIPDVGPSFTASSFRRTPLKREDFAGWVHFGRGRVPEHMAEVKEMFL